MSSTLLAQHLLGDTVVRYPRDPATGRVGLELLPASELARALPRRATLRGQPFIDAIPSNDAWPAAVIDSLVQFKLVGDEYPGGFAQGHTLRQSPGIDAFNCATQRVERNAGGSTIVTTLTRADGCRIEHRLTSRDGEPVFEITSTFINGSPAPVTLELLSSFSLGGITPFARDDAPDRLRVHRFRSGWSAEGRLETRSIEELHLERSWSGAAAFSERFGQVGSMPVRHWFPFVAVEDVAAGVVWGAQLAWAGSWQLEVYRQHDDVCLSGGLADREFGHWLKTLAPGEALTSPTGYVSCVHGSLDELCDRLTSVQHRAADAHPSVERDLPIVFNEWCTTWGSPSEATVASVARRLAGSDVRYFVIDAGWYQGDAGDWGNAHGDWIPSAKLFPHGIEAAAAAIRESGLIPGLWFEMETVGDASTAFAQSDLLLQRDGLPITVRHRRFWDLRNPRAVDYLAERVIGLIRRAGFGYLKIDYNETIGLGCSGAESLGEGLRQQIVGVHAFFDRIRAELPELVIENCASGGHRLEPSMLGRTAMSSFSDAHELPEIPIIAANLHRLMLPRQSQIWAVLHRTDSDARLRYSLAATFLGRMCLSGEYDRLSEAQLAIVQQATSLYRRAATTIKHGVSRRFGEVGSSWRHPRGWQAVRRISADNRTALVVVHAFESAPIQVDIPVPGQWQIAAQFSNPALLVRINDDGESLHLSSLGEFDAAVVLLSRT